MRVQFLLPFLGLTGGIRSVFEHSRLLRESGHEVTLLVPGRPPLRPSMGSARAWKRYLQEKFGPRVRSSLRAYGLEQCILEFNPATPGSVPSADAIVATAWNTAEWLGRVPESAASRYYFLQGYEVWDEALRHRVENTWKLPFRRLVVAPWLERLAREKLGVDVWGRVPSGVDLARFSPPAARSRTPLTVGMPYEFGEWKGTEFGIETLRRVHEANPRVRFRLLGRLRVTHQVPPGTDYLRGVSEGQLPEIYRNCHIFLSPSLMEGFSLITLEALASGCALVATAVGAVPDMGEPGRDYLMVPPRDPLAMADAVLGLLGDPERLSAVARTGRSLAERFGWPAASRAMVRCLTSANPVPATEPWRMGEEARP